MDKSLLLPNMVHRRYRRRYGLFHVLREPGNSGKMLRRHYIDFVLWVVTFTPGLKYLQALLMTVSTGIDTR
jgi:hypothetical protein